MDKKNKSIESINLLQSQIQTLTEKVNVQSQTIQKQANLIQEKEFSENIIKLTNKVNELTSIINGNVNLMDDILEHTNTILTTWVFWATIVITIVGILLPFILSSYLNKKSNIKVQEILEKSFRNKEVKTTINTCIGEYFDTATGKETLKLTTNNTEKVEKRIEGINND